MVRLKTSWRLWLTFHQLDVGEWWLAEVSFWGKLVACWNFRSPSLLESKHLVSRWPLPIQRCVWANSVTASSKPWWHCSRFHHHISDSNYYYIWWGDTEPTSQGTVQNFWQIHQLPSLSCWDVVTWTSNMLNTIVWHYERKSFSRKSKAGAAFQTYQPGWRKFKSTFSAAAPVIKTIHLLRRSNIVGQWWWFLEDTTALPAVLLYPVVQVIQVVLSIRNKKSIHTIFAHCTLFIWVEDAPKWCKLGEQVIKVFFFLKKNKPKTLHSL